MSAGLLVLLSSSVKKTQKAELRDSTISGDFVVPDELSRLAPTMVIFSPLMFIPLDKVRIRYTTNSNWSPYVTGAVLKKLGVRRSGNSAGLGLGVRVRVRVRFGRSGNSVESYTNSRYKSVLNLGLG